MSVVGSVAKEASAVLEDKVEKVVLAQKVTRKMVQLWLALEPAAPAVKVVLAAKAVLVDKVVLAAKAVMP